MTQQDAYMYIMGYREIVSCRMKVFARETTLKKQNKVRNNTRCFGFTLTG